MVGALTGLHAGWRLHKAATPGRAGPGRAGAIEDGSDLIRNRRRERGRFTIMQPQHQRHPWRDSGWNSGEHRRLG